MLPLGEPGAAVRVAPGDRLEAFVGEGITLHTPDTPLPSSVAVAHSPPAAKADVAGTTVTPNAPGLHSVRVSCGTWSATIEFVAFLPDVLEHPALVHIRGDTRGPRPMRDRRAILRALVREPQVLDLAAVAASTSDRPCAWLAGVSLERFGA